MPEIEHFGIYAAAVLLLNISPGNDFIFVATQTVSRGLRAGIISALGISAGLVIHVCASVFGLSVILAQSAFTFNLIKYTGAVYLIYLGLKMLFSAGEKIIQWDKGEVPLLSYAVIFRQGFLTNVFNPKVALFFLSFLPQFADVNSKWVSFQLLALGSWFILSGTIVNIVIACLFYKIRSWVISFKKFRQWQQKITGTILIGLGLKIAFTENK